MQSPRRETFLPKLQSILTPRNNTFVSQKHYKQIFSQEQCPKVNVSFKSPRKTLLSYGNEPIQMICSYQKQLLNRYKDSRGKHRYSVMTVRNNQDKQNSNDEDIFVKRDRLSMLKNNMKNNKVSQYSQRLVSSSIKKKAAPLKKINKQVKQTKQWQLEGWYIDPELDNRTPDFDFKL